MITSIDIGASLTKAAVWDGIAADVTPVVIEKEAQWSSSIALQRDRSLVTGQIAWHSRKSVRDASRYFAGLKQLVNLAADVEPVHREIFFPSGDTRPVTRGVLTVLDHVLTVVRAEHGHPEHVVLTHPVMWRDLEKAVLVEAAAALGLRSVGLISEAEAAGRHAAALVGLRGTMAVFDLGASTFDFAVLRTGADGVPEVLATAGRMCGGDDFSARLLRLVRQEADPEALAELERKLSDDPETVTFQANSSKIALSTEDSTLFTVGNHNVELYVEDFDEAIAPLVRSCLATVVDAVRSLGATKIDRVVLAGGAARVPQFVRRVQSLADEWAAEFTDLSGESVSSAAALGAPRRPRPWTQERPRARRPFTRSARAAVLARPDNAVVGVPGGVVVLSAAQVIERHRMSGGAAGETVGGPLTPVTRIAADPSTARLLWASPSPALTLSELGAGGELRRGVVFGRLGASPGRPDGEISVLACRGPLVAWTQAGERGATLIDTRDWNWRSLPLREPVRELAFTDTSLLLVRSHDSLVVVDVRTLDEIASISLPGKAPFAVEPVHDLVCVAVDGVVVTYRVSASGFSPQWKRDLPSAGVVVYPHGTTSPVLIVHDGAAGAYRAFDELSGEQIALCDNDVTVSPDALFSSPDAGVVYARSGRVVDRLHLAEATP